MCIFINEKTTRSDINQDLKTKRRDILEQSVFSEKRNICWQCWCLDKESGVRKDNTIYWAADQGVITALWSVLNTEQAAVINLTDKG